MKPTTVLILGGTGMIGHALLRKLSLAPNLQVYATARSLEGVADRFPEALRARILAGVDASNSDDITRALASVQPDVVINCIGLIKQLPTANDHLLAISLNALLPHRVALACRAAKARLIHISTDCVFDGKKGNYTERDLPNAEDIYGRTKMLGEIDGAHSLTLRTSAIGHELKTRLELVDWFLSQTGSVRGFAKAIYSGLPTVELARVIADFVIPNPGLHGIYNVSSAPIAKYDLLRMIAERYRKTINIEPFDGFVQDRSLDSALFRAKTGYAPPAWAELIDAMHADYEAHQETYHGAV